ncbi:MAG: hypothetical protein RR816_09230, partial [Clostridia bacterium]
MEITVKYKKSETLLAELAALQSAGSLSAEQITRMQEISASLVSLYPSLKQYVGSNGIMNAEAGQIQKVITEYANLERQIAYFNQIKSIEGQTAEGEFNFLIAQKESEQANQEWVALSQKYATLKQTNDKLSAQANMIWENQILPDDASDQTYKIDEYIKSIQDYQTAMGDLEGVDISSIENSHLIFDDLSNIKSAEEISQSSDAMIALTEYIVQLAKVSNESMDETKAAADAAGNNVVAAAQALKDYEAIFAGTASSVAASKAVFEEQWNVNYDEVKKLTDNGMSLNDALVKLGATSQETVNSLNAVDQVSEDTTESLTGKGQDLKDSTDDVMNAAITAKETAGEAVDQLSTQALTVEELTTKINEATTAGVAAQTQLAAAKTAVTADAQTILTDMTTLITALGVDVATMVQTMNDLV